MKKASCLSSTISTTLPNTYECNLLTTPGADTKLISKSSGLDTALIAFTYATEPLAVDEDKLNPCELPADISEPNFFLIVGDTPSNPLWNPTVNCLLAISVASEPVIS